MIKKYLLIPGLILSHFSYGATLDVEAAKDEKALGVLIAGTNTYTGESFGEAVLGSGSLTVNKGCSLSRDGSEIFIKSGPTLSAQASFKSTIHPLKPVSQGNIVVRGTSNFYCGNGSEKFLIKHRLTTFESSNASIVVEGKRPFRILVNENSEVVFDEIKFYKNEKSYKRLISF